MPKQLIIAAISARGLAQATHALGYKVVTIDAFADADTRKIAQQCLQVRVTDEGVDEADFKQKFEQIHLAESQFVYGSLFDAKPALLEWVAQKISLVGNLSQTLQLTKSFEFFEVLDCLAIQHPEVCLDAPKQVETWLVKRSNGTGGVHVKLAKTRSEGEYFQRKVEGEPVSFLFLADGESVKKVGFNQQLLAPTTDAPYRFAGAVSHTVLPLSAQQMFIKAAERLTQALKLRGLNSLDAVLQGENLWILELNPRLSATFQLYPNLMQAHLKAAEGVLVDLPENKTSKAEFVLYADKQLHISTEFIWPNWTADIPYIEAGGLIVNQNEPICTVLAEGENALAAHQLLMERVRKLKGTLFYDER